MAVHYLNDDSIDPDYYRAKGEETAANVLSRLHSCLKTGAIVAASYREIKPGMLKVGRVDPLKSKIRARQFLDRDRGKLIYKTVNLIDVKNIDLSQYVVLSGIQPRGGTLTGWDSARKILECILADKTLPLELNSLHWSQLEVLCYEFLRDSGELKNLLAPIGRNLYEVDICGLASDGELLLAQVTHSGNKKITEDKVRRLGAFAGKNRKLIYFGPSSSPPNESRVLFISIEKVFDQMLKKNSKLIKSMLKADWVKS